ncbi:Dat protein [Plakobranchus ocellatus]|uniref:Dat protein n=1 Tax=Plakobranchus ocellatus TaxID=259542 RepID=A0AAV4CPA7_9GAST|nr:Dat protein [Plakobranchus ocellatus]
MKSFQPGANQSAEVLSRKKMTVQEKLDFIDDEIRKICAFCTKSGCSASQIETFAKPFFQRDVHHFSTSIWASGKAWKRRGVALTAVLVATVLLFRFDPAYRLACALSKQGAIQILPVWDWTEIYTSRCWLENPLYQVAPGLQMSDCEICEGIDSIDRLTDLDPGELIKWYISRDTPVIVEDGNRDWRDVANYSSLADFAKIFVNNPALRGYRSCHFSTNLRQKNLDHVDLLEMLIQGQMDKFYGQWENCNAQTYKAFRRMFKKPYFLPPTIGVASPSWVFISANYSGKIFKPVEISGDLVLFMQITGASRVRLEPWEPCTGVCKGFDETLREGSILVATDFLWKIDYIPTNNAENIAIAVGGSFDYR